jgi:hypothetical protein
MEEAVPHQIRVQHYAEMVNKPTTEVVLEAARGPVGGPKLTVGRKLWDRIRSVALPRYQIEDDRTVVPVCEAAIFVAALKQNEAKTEGWSAADKEVFRDVLRLLYQHQGLVLARR